MSEKERASLFDPIRRKRVAATPEEQVRQAFVRYLLDALSYPISRIANEYCITIGKLSRRCDTVIFSPTMTPLMVIEYKAPHVHLTQSVVDQAFRYNSVLRVPYILLTNGKELLLYNVGYDGETTRRLDRIPSYTELEYPAGITKND